MSTLSDILAESVAAVEIPGRPIDTHAAAKYGVAKILANAELNCMAVTEWFIMKCQAFLKGGNKRRALPSAAEYVMAHRASADGGEGVTLLVPRQFDFFVDPFKLYDAHKVEGGDGRMQRTRNSNMYEFEGFLRIRDKQIEADIRYANKMRRTLERLRPIWVVDPMMTYEETCDLYIRQHGMPPEEDEDEEDAG